MNHGNEPKLTDCFDLLALSTLAMLRHRSRNSEADLEKIKYDFYSKLSFFMKMISNSIQKLKQNVTYFGETQS
jgi:hypothetical protein